eukprot:g1861.t1
MEYDEAEQAYYRAADERLVAEEVAIDVDEEEEDRRLAKAFTAYIQKHKDEKSEGENIMPIARPDGDEAQSAQISRVRNKPKAADQDVIRFWNWDDGPGSSSAMVELLATFGAAAKELFDYNREMYQFDQGQRLDRELLRLEMQIKRFQLFREDIRDLVELTVAKMEMYHVVGALGLLRMAWTWQDGKKAALVPKGIGAVWSEDCEANTMRLLLAAMKWPADVVSTMADEKCSVAELADPERGARMRRIQQLLAIYVKENPGSEDSFWEHAAIRRAIGRMRDRGFDAEACKKYEYRLTTFMPAGTGGPQPCQVAWTDEGQAVLVEPGAETSGVTGPEQSAGEQQEQVGEKAGERLPAVEGLVLGTPIVSMSAMNARLTDFERQGGNIMRIPFMQGVPQWQQRRRDAGKNPSSSTGQGEGDEEYLTAVVKPGEMKQQDTARRLFDPFRLNVLGDSVDEKFRLWAIKLEDYVSGVFGCKSREVLEWAASMDNEIAAAEIDSNYGSSADILDQWDGVREFNEQLYAEIDVELKQWEEEQYMGNVSGGLQKAAVNLPGKHIKLFRELQAKWQCYDAYARVCMSFGVNHICMTMSYYMIGLTVLEYRSPSIMFALVTVFQATNLALAWLDVAGLKRKTTTLLEFIGACEQVYTDRYQGGPIGASTLDAAKKSLADLVIFDETNRPPGASGVELCKSASLPCPKFNTVGFRTALLGLPLTIILSLQQALCWAGARSPVLRRRVALPAALIDIPTVEELDDMYPDLYRTGLAVLAKGENWAASGRPGLTLMGRAKRTFRRKLHLLGRLDRTVSGITLLAFDAETAEAFESVNKSRTYYALCRNSGEFFFDRGEFAVNRPLKDKRAKESHTDVQVLFGSKDPNCCLVRAKPTTGRYHQIRRHLRNISLPVLGDTYCKKKTRQYFASHGVELPRRVLLHLSSLSVPATAKTPKIHVTCPLPPNFQALIRSSFPSWAAEVRSQDPSHPWGGKVLR